MRRFTKYPVIAWVLIFSLWPITPVSAARCKTTWERAGRLIQFWRWGETESPVGAVQDAVYSMELEKRIRAWGNAAGRTASHREVKRSRIASFVLKSMEFDRYFVTIEYLKPQFLEMQLSFSLYKLNARMKGELVNFVGQLKANMAVQDIATIADWAKRFDIEDAGLLTALASKDPATVLAAAEALIKAIDKHSEQLAMAIAYHFDEYEAGKSMLEVCRSNGEKAALSREELNEQLDGRRAIAALEAMQAGPLPAEVAVETESPARENPKERHFDYVGRQAVKVLERLETARLLEGYKIMRILTGDEAATPSTKDFKQILKEHPGAADARRRWNGNREFFAWLLSISPTDGMINLLDKSAARVPYLNNPKFRAFLQFALSESHVEIYYPDIARVVDSTSNGKHKLEMVEIMNAQTDDRFIVTLRRRLDARDEWEAMKKVANEREDKSFHKRMEQAEVTATTLGDLNPWQSETNRATKLFRRLFDALLVGGTVGGGVWATAPYWGDKTKDAIQEVVGDDDDKKEEIALTPEEQKEYDELKQDATSFLRWLQDDEEGKKLFRKYLDDKKKREEEEAKAKAQEPVSPAVDPETPPNTEAEP